MFNAEYEESEKDNCDSIAFWTDTFVIQKKLAFAITGLFVVSCTTTYFFLDDHILHHYWDSFGKFVPLISIALFIVLTMQLLRLQFAWQQKRKAQRDLEDLLIRRKA